MAWERERVGIWIVGVGPNAFIDFSKISFYSDSFKETCISAEAFLLVILETLTVLRILKQREKISEHTRNNDERVKRTSPRLV